MADPSWLDGIVSSLKTQTATWFVGILVAILTFFRDRIVESIKLSLNRAELRTRQYEDLAIDVSQYIFAAELTVEFIQRDWTTEKSLTELAKEYNMSITILRKKEFVYLGWIRKYWDRAQESLFQMFWKSLLTFDSAMHSLNDEFEAVNIKKTKDKVGRQRAEEALKIMEPALKDMRENGKRLLSALL